MTTERKQDVHMKICVLSGSPKGKDSLTFQYIRYLQAQMPSHEFNIHHIGQEVKKLEKNPALLDAVIDDVRSADGVLWTFPVYYLLVPSQFKRFIELVLGGNGKEAFRDKYTAAFSTSIHYFDHTAHNYIHGICDDLGMHYYGYFSAAMDDGMKMENRSSMLFFLNDFVSAIQEKRACQRVYPPVITRDFHYTPGEIQQIIQLNGKKIVIVADDLTGDTNLSRMIGYFRKCFSEEIPVYRLSDIDIQGGCLGCIQCGPDNICVYKDGFVEFFNSKIRGNDIVIFAGTIKDRYFSSAWKEFFDRSFFKGHVPAFPGAQLGFLISGPLGQLPNLLEIFRGYAENNRANFTCISDEAEDPEEIDRNISEFASSLMRYAKGGYIRPPTYLSEGGRKIFRDEIYGRLRFVFLADHAYYRTHGYYDFPQKDYRSRSVNAVMCILMKIPAFRQEFKKRARTEPARHAEKFFGETG